MIIRKYSDNDLLVLQNIFYSTSSKKDFKTEKEKALFFNRWAGQYLENFSDDALIAEKNGEVVGYLLGCRNTEKFLPQLLKNNKSLEVFEDLYLQFPAHLHINSDPKFQGQGIGSQLIKYYMNQLKSALIPGLHIITSPESRNVNFYRKNGFTFESLRGFLWAGVN